MTSTDAAPVRETARRMVMVVEDHQIIAQGLELALRRAGFAVVSVSGPTLDAVIDTARKKRPGMVILDLNLGELGSGLDLVGPLTDLGSRVIVLTGETNPVELGRCVEAGAVGLASKAAPFEQLLDRLVRTAGGGPGLSRPEREALLDRLRAHRAAEAERLAPFATLTAREQAVLAALMEGAGAEQIAETSYVSVATVRSQIQSILRKLAVNSQLGAVAAAQQAGWRPEP